MGINSGAPKTIKGTLTNTGEILQNDDVTLAGGTINNHGTYNLICRINAFTANQAFDQNGFLLADETSEINVGGTFTAGQDSTTIVDGTLTAAAINLEGGIFGGTGTAVAPLVNNTGTGLGPGNSEGRFTINGAYTQSDAGRLEIEISGIVPVEEYDQLVVSDTAVLGGTIVATSLDGFTAPVGSTFDVAAAASIIDDGLNLAQVNGSLFGFSIVNTAKGQTLRLAPIEPFAFGPSGGSWDDDGNWDSGKVPGASDAVLLPGDPLSDTTVTGPMSDTMTSSLVIGSGALGAPGALEAATITTLQLGNGQVATALGTTLRDDGRASGSGSFGGALYNAGMIAPGAPAGSVEADSSTGLLTIHGGYVQSSTGGLFMEIGGLTAGTDHDQLIVNGTATLGGILQVELLPSVAVSAGSTFDVVVADKFVDFFDTLDLPLDVTGDPLFDVQIVPTNSMAVRLTALRAISELGDVNSDGSVNNLDITPFIVALSAAGNEADFLAEVPGGNFFAADIDMIGSPNNLDITPFIRLLTLATSDAPAVPEPTSLAPFMLLLTACTGRGKRAAAGGADTRAFVKREHSGARIPSRTPLSQEPFPAGLENGLSKQKLEPYREWERIPTQMGA